MAIVNRYNFLRWSDQTTVGGAGGDFLSEDFDSGIFFTGGGAALPMYSDPGDLPRGYWFDRERCPYKPVLVTGDVMSFYVNTVAGITVTDFSDLRLRFIRPDGTVASSGFTVLYPDQISTGKFNVYATFFVPSLPDGTYHLQIHKNSDGASVLISNPLIARSDSHVAHQTLTARFRNEQEFFNVRYGFLGGFYQQFRLNMNVIDRQYESDKEIYTSVTSGKTRSYNDYLRRYLKFETYYFDPGAHEACAALVQHDFVELNGLRFQYKQPYKETVDFRSKISKGEFEMYDDDFGRLNRCVVTPTLVLGDGNGIYVTDGNGNLIRVR